MRETPQQYTARILSYQRNQDPLNVQQDTARKIAGVIRKLSPRQLRTRPAPGKWSIAEILAHLADTELVGGYRLRMILSRNGTPIQAFDQDIWAKTGRYERRNPHRSLEMFKILRAANLSLLQSLPPRMWRHYGMHAERGKETVRRVAKMYAGHDINHQLQIERIARQLRRA